jgi:hypothetical protein
MIYENRFKNVLKLVELNTTLYNDINYLIKNNKKEKNKRMKYHNAIYIFYLTYVL